MYLVFLRYFDFTESSITNAAIFSPVVLAAIIPANRTLICLPSCYFSPLTYKDSWGDFGRYISLSSYRERIAKERISFQKAAISGTIGSDSLDTSVNEIL